MNYQTIKRTTTLYFLRSLFSVTLMLPVSAMAENYWVLGSYNQSHGLLDQANLIAAKTGLMPVSLDIERDGLVYHRLVVPEIEVSQVISSQLIELEISPWLMTVSATQLAELTQVDVKVDVKDDGSKLSSQIANRHYMIEVGSYSDVDTALATERRLGEVFLQVTGRSQLVTNKVMHHVAIGPIAEDELETATQLLANMGFKNVTKRLTKAEVMPSVSTASVSLVKEVEKSPTVKPNGFNLARLPKKKASITEFVNFGDALPESRLTESWLSEHWFPELSFEYRRFSHPGFYQPSRDQASVVLSSELSFTVNDEQDTFRFIPFYRYDAEDTERSHFDIRELSWVHSAEFWELRTGISKVFWGVTETQHLTDIVNQTDQIENLDGEEKLGQGMINLSLSGDWGILDTFVLPGFRERTYPGKTGRLHGSLIVDTEKAYYESGAENLRTDFAIRWYQTVGDLELGISHFSGTSREPTFQLQPGTTNPNLVNQGRAFSTLIPFYQVIDQTGLDAQLLTGDWAWKLEAISRSGQGERYSAATFGFEKTLVGVFGSRMDVGIIAEYLYDSRKLDAAAVGEDDYAIGMRALLNDVSGTTFLVLVLIDGDSDETYTAVEVNTRLGDSWAFGLEASIFSGEPNLKFSSPAEIDYLFSEASFSTQELRFLQNEDFLQLVLTKYL